MALEDIIVSIIIYYFTSIILWLATWCRPDYNTCQHPTSFSYSLIPLCAPAVISAVNLPHSQAILICI